MPDPTSFSGAVVSVAVFGFSVALGVDEVVVVCSIAGALVAGTQSSRLDWNLLSVLAGLASFVASVMLGIVGGPFVGGVLMAGLLRLGVSLPLGGHAADGLLSLFMSMYGLGRILPAVAARLGVEIETRRAGQ